MKLWSCEAEVLRWPTTRHLITQSLRALRRGESFNLYFLKSFLFYNPSKFYLCFGRGTTYWSLLCWNRVVDTTYKETSFMGVVYFFSNLIYVLYSQFQFPSTLFKWKHSDDTRNMLHTTRHETNQFDNQVVASSWCGQSILSCKLLLGCCWRSFGK